MTYQTDLRKLAGDAERQAQNLYAAFQSGKVDEATFKAALVEVVLTMMRAANEVAQATLEKLLQQDSKTPVRVPLEPGPDAADRLGQAVVTVLANPNAPMAVGRLAKHATLESAQLGWGTALQSQPGVDGWTRGLHAGACQVCEGLAGTVLSLSTPMYHHPGCTCYQKPVFGRTT